MTLTNRNRIIRTLIVFSTLLSVTIITATVIMCVRGKLPVTPVGPRLNGMAEYVPLLSYSTAATVSSIVLFSVYSTAMLFFVFYKFEKTKAVEITFFTAFLAACQLESLRIFVPLFQLWIGYSSFFTFIARAVFFSRLYALLTLLFSGIASNGGLEQSDRNMYLLIVVPLIFSSVVPLNTTAMTSTFMITFGYSTTFLIIRILFACGAVMTFFLIGITRDIKEYKKAAAGLLFVLAGYAALINSDNFMFLLCGAAALVSGTLYFLKNIHNYYMWQ